MINESLHITTLNKKHILMNTFENILIVDSNKNDLQLVSLLFKRSLNSTSSLIITCASSISEAKDALTKKQFSIVTLDGEFPGFVDQVEGHTLIPFIKETQKELPITIMVANERVHIKKGLKNGADFGFHKQQIQGEVKFNERFELVPLQ